MNYANYINFTNFKQNEDNTTISSESFIGKRNRAEVSMKKLEMMDGALTY